MQENDYQNLRDYALKLLSLRPRSVKEISIKLKQYCSKKHLDEKLFHQLLEELKKFKLVDDEEFAKWWIKQRQDFRPKGIRHIQFELQDKGIDRSILDKIVNNGSETISEFDLALKVIGKKKILLGNLSKEKLKIKIRDLLYRRGFDWDTISKVIDSVVEKS